MATLEEKLCPVCFQEAMEGGKCQNCGYVLDKASVGENHLNGNCRLYVDWNEKQSAGFSSLRP